MKKHVLFSVLLSISVCSFGQLPQSRAIDSIFREWDKDDVPGCALGVIKDGELVYARGYGLANMEYGIPNSAASVFRIGSTSKQFTAACIVLLAEQGRLSLDDNLKSFFPEFPGYAEKITVRHLLNHTSGIRDYLQLTYLKGFRDDDFYLDEDVMRWLVNQEDLNFAPGDEFLYSNSGYWLLGQIVNKVSGKNMADFAREEIFMPLGMVDTHFHNDHRQIVKHRASGYAPKENGDFEISMTTLDMIGDGGVFTTINDIKKWDDAFYASEVLSRSFWEEMTRQGVLNNGEVIEYASGLDIGSYKGLKTIRHGGAFVGFRAELLRFPEEHLSIAIFANRADANPSVKAEQVAGVLLKDKLVEPEGAGEAMAQDDHAGEEYPFMQLVGTYEIEPGLNVNFTIEKDSLYALQSWNQSSYPIVRISGNTFQIPGNEGIQFLFSDLEEGQAQTLTVFQGGRETKTRRKKDIDASGVDLEEYAGSYYSRELDVVYDFRVEDGILKAGIAGNTSATACTLSDVDQFAIPFGLARFQRKDGKISGFELDSGRVKNLKFKKD